MTRLDGKVCFVTGTAGGQGAAAAVLFEAEGATVVGCDIKTDGIDLADPEQAALFLASDDAAYLNAIDIVVDGGQSVIV